MQAALHARAASEDSPVGAAVPQVYKHWFGGQGPALLEALNILEQFDLHAMKHNSADYIHTVVEALKLAYADRDSYYGDPAFVETPAEGLLS
jgi:gamma-glutamyltranspeptidase/glutathione hydrolase